MEKAIIKIEFSGLTFFHFTVVLVDDEEIVGSDCKSSAAKSP